MASVVYVSSKTPLVVETVITAPASQGSSRFCWPSPFRSLKTEMHSVPAANVAVGVLVGRVVAVGVAVAVAGGVAVSVGVRVDVGVGVSVAV
jgi:hypothetical protein